jgi:hypothetical protein
MLPETSTSYRLSISARNALGWSPMSAPVLQDYRSEAQYVVNDWLYLIENIFVKNQPTMSSCWVCLHMLTCKQSLSVSVCLKPHILCVCVCVVRMYVYMYVQYVSMFMFVHCMYICMYNI